MRVLEPGDRRRPRAERSDELRIVGNRSTHDLDGDLTADGCLIRPKQAVPAVAGKELPQLVAVDRPAGFEQGGDRCRFPACNGTQVVVVVEDLLLELLQLRRRVDPQLVGQQPPRLLICAEGISLPARSIQGEHELAPETFSKRVLGRQVLELGNESLMPTEGQMRVDAQFHGGEPQTVQPSRQVPQGGRLVGDIDQRNAVPEIERIREAPAGLRRV